MAGMFDNIPPNIFLVTGRNKPARQDEESVDTLDFADIQSADMIINPSHWEANGKSGIKAYLRTMYVVIQEDRFAAKYAHEE